MHKDIQTYNNSQTAEDKEICDLLSQEICKHLPEAENKIWHSHPVWFLEENPIVGYSKLKAGLQLMFWRNPKEIKKVYPSASFLVDNRVVFNIKGNKYRLIVKINYDYSIIWIRFVGTHAEYDKIDATKI